MLREPRYCESVRTAVTGVQLALADVEHPVVAITSSVPGEGKSTFAVAFALEQSRTRRVLLIDADLRRPSVVAMLGMPDRLPGVRELVRGQTVGECIHRIPETQLDVLPAARRSKNPLDLLAHPRFPQALRELRRYYDLIVIDTPPVELFSDALLVARQADGVAFIARASDTPVAMIERGLARLRGADVTVLGVVMNAHDFTRAGRYYGETAAQARYDYASRVAA
jgi:capsular exopolysaccharide synthesis family protein